MESVLKKINLHITQQCFTCREVGKSCGAGSKCQDSSCLIFPFQEDDAMHCNSCGSVYHRSCLRKLSGCLLCSYTNNAEYSCKELALADEPDARSQLSSDSNSKLEDLSHPFKQGTASSKGFVTFFVRKKIASNML